MGSKQKSRLLLKATRGQKACWNEYQITDMIDIIVNDDELVKKVIFTNIKKASNSKVLKNVLTQLNEKYNATTGKEFPFIVAQMIRAASFTASGWHSSFRYNTLHLLFS